MSDDREQIAVFEKMGKEAVRSLVYTAGFNHINQRLAIKWLAQRDQGTERRGEASQAEQIDNARSAKDAAWEAARAAKIANKIATAALIAAAIAIVVSIISLIRSHRLPYGPTSSISRLMRWRATAAPARGVRARGIA